MLFQRQENSTPCHPMLLNKNTKLVDQHLPVMAGGELVGYGVKTKLSISLKLHHMKSLLAVKSQFSIEQLQSIILIFIT